LVITQFSGNQPPKKNERSRSENGGKKNMTEFFPLWERSGIYNLMDDSYTRA
jgi:hypothetical protein